MDTNNDDVVKKLNELIKLDFDAIEAYEVAIEKLESQPYREQLTQYLEDHRRHINDLSALVLGYGGTAATGPDLKRLLTKGKVVIADLIGDDQAILSAMHLNEEITNKAYDAALSHIGNVKSETRVALQSNLADERRHRAWLEQQIKKEKAAA